MAKVALFNKAYQVKCLYRLSSIYDTLFHFSRILYRHQKGVFMHLLKDSIFRYKRLKQGIHPLRVWKSNASSERIARVASCMEPYFSLQTHVKPELAHRLQTSKMRRNSTSLNTCQHDVNIVTVWVTRWRYKAPLKSRRRRQSIWCSNKTLYPRRAIILRTGAERDHSCCL